MSEVKTFKIVNNDISDGYHTFDELYEHRCLLFLNICLMQPKNCAYKRDYENWFCLYLETKNGQISYHIQNKYLPMIEGKISHEPIYYWDGHDSKKVLEVLKKELGNE